MSNKAIVTEKAPAAVGPYSAAIQAGNCIHVSGQLPIDPATGAFAGEDIASQTRQSLTNIKNILEAAGATMAKVAEVREAYALGGDDGNEVPAAKLAVLAVVECLDLAQLHFGLVPGKNDMLRCAVVAVPVAAYHRVGLQLRQLKPGNGAGGIGVEDHRPVLADDLKA